MTANRRFRRVVRIGPVQVATYYDGRGREKHIDGINADEWTPRELRHSFVSLLSDRGVPLEVISRLVGHSGTAVTEEVYRKQIRPVIQTGAVVMDGIFGADPQRP
ncbi:tyrosine-type recombinase/integrase [Streptomyces sp. NA02536]|uniref:tyrosine-type recombinase/integrase n=1 Tax=Streptomyces sp. NA02536 TaxID=2742133 RepID=UPI00159292C7|nr:tyrosine-type recombinase/integrase [Streptomyces sp. NA02536]QKW01700.1 tyrosine-type recombinase/integrase [Streptomyces sp. NA02536]